MYTLTTWALWLAAAAAIGLVVGWLLGRIRPRLGADAPASRAAMDDDRPGDSEGRDSGEHAAPGDADVAPTVSTPVTVAVVDSALEAEHYAALSQLEQVTAERDELRRELRKRRHEPAPPAPANGDAERLASELRVRLWNAEATITELRERLRTAEGEGAGA